MQYFLLPLKGRFPWGTDEAQATNRMLEKVKGNEIVQIVDRATSANWPDTDRLTEDWKMTVLVKSAD